MTISLTSITNRLPAAGKTGENLAAGNSNERQGKDMKEKMEEISGKMSELSSLVRRKDDEEKVDGVANVIVWVLIIVGIVALVAAIAFAVYKYVTPN